MRANFEQSCIAQRMSWVSRQVTTREEDLAYCLLGLFKVNMPLLYGEGFSKAFLRLQLEILASYNDDSIFAWDPTGHTWPSTYHPWSGMLAPSPENFVNCGRVTPITSLGIPSQELKMATHTITYRGIELSMPLLRTRPGRQWIERVLYRLMCERAPYQRIFLKLWIEISPGTGGPYADGARLAWRSGCATSPPAGNAISSSLVMGIQPYAGEVLARAHKLQLQLQSVFCGSRETKLLELSASEAYVCHHLNLDRNFIRNWGMKISRLVVDRGLDKARLNRTKLANLYFKTTWTEDETPDDKGRLFAR